MIVKIRKTYRGISPEMLCNEIQDLVQKLEVIAAETESQTYGLPSGATQSRTTFTLKTWAEQEKDQKECGTVHIVGSPAGETKMMLDIDENLLPKEKISSLQEDLDFILGSYELKW